MDQRVTDFLNKATVAMLKDKLRDLGLQTSGNKSQLILRLEEFAKNLNSDTIDEHFSGIHYTVADTSLSPQSVQDLDEELENLRELLEKREEIAKIKKRLAEFATNDENKQPISCGRRFTLKDVEESLNKFSGDDKYGIRSWVQQLEESADTLGWDDKMCLIYGKRLLVGTAKLFSRTLFVRSWKDLKDALIREFDKKVSDAEVHNELRHRKKKHDESWQQYLFIMQDIASTANIDDSDLIQYVINGIQDSSSNKLLLYSANTIEELKFAFKKYEKMKIYNPNQAVERRKPNLSHDKKIQPVIRCYNCNQPGHISSKCLQPRREKGSCYRCGKAGHKVNECGGKSVNTLAKLDTRRQQKHNFEQLITYKIYHDENDTYFRCELLSLLDSGSPISIIQEQFVPPFMLKHVDPDKYSFCGINSSKLHIVGIIKVKIYFKEKCIDLEIFVVKNFSMSYPVILGRNFMNVSNLELLSKNANLYIQRNNDKKESEIEELKNTSVVSNETPCVDDENSGTSHISENDSFFKEILCIDITENNVENHIIFEINYDLPFEIKRRVKEILKPAWFLNKNDRFDNLKDDYVIEHRNGEKMSHADGLSRAINILYVKDESFEYVLAASQRQDPALVAIASDLEKQESSSYDMVDGLIYRKVKDGLRFYVPKNMEYRVIQTHHDAMCHIGVEKCYEQLRRTYWFPSMKQRIKDYIKSCLKCAYFSPNSGKTEGTLHSIPKGKLLFDTLHIDHYGPLASSKAKSRFILVVIDCF